MPAIFVSTKVNDPKLVRGWDLSKYKSSVACVEDLWTLDRTCSGSYQVFSGSR